MKLQYRFILFIILIVFLFIALSVRLLPEHKWLFLISELAILLIVVISIHLYKVFVRPINLISAGIESIKDRDFNTSFLKVGQSEIDSLVDVYNEMINRIRHERIEKQEQQYFLDKLIQASPTGIVILDFENRINSINPSAIKTIALPEENVLGKSFSELENELATQLQNLHSGKSKIITINGIQKYKCQKAHFVDRGFNHHFILIEELSEEIIRTEKNAFGKVIRMMSHEINNSIGAINSILNTVLRFKSQLSDTDRTDYEEALNVAIERNNNLNQFMSNYADIIRIPPPHKISFSLSTLLDKIKILVDTNLQKHSITWNVIEATEPFQIHADIAQFELVLLNIIKNAIEAIGNHGSINIIMISAPQKMLIIQDTGSGISQENKQNIFTPFFSTKQNGQGIGLTLVREVLTNHGFQFSLSTITKNCTEFRIFF